VLIELRDRAGKFTATKTDSRGQFKFGNVHEGTHTFKITLDGFPSVVGTVGFAETRQELRGHENRTTPEATRLTPDWPRSNFGPT